MGGDQGHPSRVIPVDGDVILAEYDRPENAHIVLDQLGAAEIDIAAIHHTPPTPEPAIDRPAP